MNNELPKTRAIKPKFSAEAFYNQALLMSQRLEQYKYKEKSNDLRSDYLRFIDDADDFLKLYKEMVLDVVDIIEYYENVRQEIKALGKIARQYAYKSRKFENEMMEKGIDILNPTDTVDKIDKELSEKAGELMERKERLDKVEEEIAITSDMLQKKKSEMEKALQTRYTLTDTMKQVLIEEKDKILDGIEQWGSVYTALSHDKTIRSKASTIFMYCQKYPEFGAAIEVSKQIFKEKIDGIMIERALEGTENPVFQKGEHLGDFKIKDNKLLLELMKAKVPEQYNKKSTENVKNQQINNMQIISFAGVDETKEGYTKDVGVVLDVDDTGKVQRILQEKKMKEFYEKKPGAILIEAEKVEDDEQ